MLTTFQSTKVTIMVNTTKMGTNTKMTEITKTTKTTNMAETINGMKRKSPGNLEIKTVIK